MHAEEYDRDLENRMQMMSAANMRGDQGGQYTAGGPGTDSEMDDDMPGGAKRRKNMRGRKGKYYS